MAVWVPAMIASPPHRDLHPVGELEADGSLLLVVERTHESAELETKSVVPHDFIHYALESIAGLRSSVWGLVARGYSFVELNGKDAMKGASVPRDELAHEQNGIGLDVSIRKAEASDAAAIAAIILPTIREGATYALDPDMSEADALAYWMGSDKETFVAEEDGVILGTYYIRPNQAGGGRHVCNCGYMTSATATGRGIARRMCHHSMDYARSKGYRAMQFNFVVSTNERAVRLWQSLGFEIVGRLPLAFRHPTAGYVDALVMYQQL